MDERYGIVKDYIEQDKILEFRDIFKYLPKTVLTKDWGSNNYRVTRFIEYPQQLSIEEIYEIARLINVHPDLLIKMILRQFNNTTVSTKKRK
ncbi:hypothetical protein D3H65_01225 [Paraflavitalea soli]|uniref:XRE family transcriptional regulator n=1 Tax=Paraflavitalea soli TaxID=2315862 RepID=A0A3B7MEB0_9BACT|nr:hypothetical protein [Paraflavitalea soli]AXY72678.1 hypothetical protein D3H65_01225 [Paraflavitalea soli]